MKTIREWASELPKEFEASILSQSNRLDSEAHDLLGAVHAFKSNWKDTVEGVLFWRVVSSEIEKYLYLRPYRHYLTSESDTVAIDAMQGWDGAKTFNPQPHYDNSKGSLYKVATERGWNAYLFDIVKRLERAEKKGEFETDLQKSIDVIKIWMDENRN